VPIFRRIVFSKRLWGGRRDGVNRTFFAWSARWGCGGCGAELQKQGARSFPWARQAEEHDFAKKYVQWVELKSSCLGVDDDPRVTYSFL
jgi:hypothetical protein